jgi:hypothetical protein
MTEAEWLACTDPQQMLEFLQLRRKASDRKLRLLAVACWYRYENLKYSVSSWVATEASEQRAETLKGVSAREHKRTRQELKFAVSFIGERSLKARREERAAQASLLRCIFGNPFRPSASDPSWLAWRDGTIPKLAQPIYEERAFDRLPILADALEDAGCDNKDLLNHCRSGGEHVRGCWVVDLLLGKE